MRRGREKVCRCRVFAVGETSVVVRTENGKRPSEATIAAITAMVEAFKNRLTVTRNGDSLASPSEGDRRENVPPQ